MCISNQDIGGWLKCKMFALSSGDASVLKPKTKLTIWICHRSDPAQPVCILKSEQLYWETYIDIMQQVLLLIDFVGLYTILICQSENAVLGRSDVSPAEINPFCLLIL